MRVKALTAFVTRLGGEAVSVGRGNEQELPDRLAARLVDAGIAESLDEQPENPEADRLAAEQAEADRLAAEQAEAERLAAEQAERDKAASARSPKKGTPSGKKLDGAPENK